MSEFQSEGISQASGGITSTPSIEAPLSQPGLENNNSLLEGVSQLDQPEPTGAEATGSETANMLLDIAKDGPDAAMERLANLDVGALNSDGENVNPTVDAGENLQEGREPAATIADESTNNQGQTIETKAGPNSVTDEVEEDLSQEVSQTTTNEGQSGAATTGLVEESDKNESGGTETTETQQELTSTDEKSAEENQKGQEAGEKSIADKLMVAENKIQDLEKRLDQLSANREELMAKTNKVLMEILLALQEIEQQEEQETTEQKSKRNQTLKKTLLRIAIMGAMGGLLSDRPESGQTAKRK